MLLAFAAFWLLVWLISKEKEGTYQNQDEEYVIFEHFIDR